MKRKNEKVSKEKRGGKRMKYIPKRFVLAILISLFEVLTILFIVVALCYWVPYFYIAAYLTEIFCIIRIVSSDDNPEYKVPWLLVVLLLPIAGFMLYFLFYKRQLEKRLVKRLERLDSEKYESDGQTVLDELSAKDPCAASSVKLLAKTANATPFCGGEIKYFPLGEDMHSALIEDLKSAKKFIFMEYFIVEEGIFWDSILDVLRERVANGVEVRVIYDDIGCMMTLPADYSKTLSSYGIMATPFSVLKGRADGEFNNRSHRKITVIDGVIGYTGGINIADEYINAKVKHGHWKDTAIRICGPAVRELTRLFLVDYGINVKSLPDPMHDYYPECGAEGGGVAVPFGDGPSPMYEHRVGKYIIMNMLEAAVRYVYITTPYLIIDNDMCTAIEKAALRGIDVRILLPHVPDKWLVLEISRSYYQRLMRAGVRIYEYEPGFMHSKTYVSDDKYAMIGTINLDYRSLVHHFECGVWIYENECLMDIKRDFEKTLHVSLEIKEKDADGVGLFRRFLRALGRIFATLM